MANAKSTKTGGKAYPVHGLPDGTVGGINKAEMVPLDEYREGTSGSPEQQERKPFGSASTP
jgi:hypothetical protein